MKKFVHKELKLDFNQRTKIVVVGDRLTKDILFGNLNRMVTVWITKYRNTEYNVRSKEL